MSTQSLENYDIRTPVSSNHDSLFDICNKLELCKSQLVIALNYAKNDPESEKAYVEDKKFIQMLESDGNLCEKIRNIVYEMKNILKEIHCSCGSNVHRDSGISLSETSSARSSLQRDSDNMEKLQIEKNAVQNNSGMESFQETSVSHDDKNWHEKEKRAANEKITNSTLVENNVFDGRGVALGIAIQTTSNSNPSLQSSDHSEDHLNNLSNEASDEDNTHQDDEMREQQISDSAIIAICDSTTPLDEDDKIAEC